MTSPPLLRDSADPNAPNGASRLYAKLRTILALLIVLPTLPLTALNIFHPQRLIERVATALLRRLSYAAAILPPAETDEERWAVPKPTISFGNLWDDVVLDVIDVPAAPQEWCTHLAQGPAEIRAIPMPGFMVSPKGGPRGSEKARDGEKIILYFHGGAYIRGHPLWMPLPTKIARDARVRVLSGQYRKTLTASTAYPAPLLDALSAWVYVTDTLGFPPTSVLVMGDSAGAHLSLALVQQLAQMGKPAPGGLALMSPWADMTFSFLSWQRNAALDHLVPQRATLAVKSLTRYYAPGCMAHPLFSPALAPKGHWESLVATPTFVSVGTSEVLEDEIRALVDGMRGDGVDVTLYEELNGLHDGPLVPFAPKETYERFRDGVVDVLKDMAQES